MDFITQEAEKFIKNNQNINSRSEILKILFNDKELKKAFPGKIRYISSIGFIAKKILELLKSDEDIEVMAIGDIKYKGKYREIMKNLDKKAKQYLLDSPWQELEGYDVTGSGNFEIKKIIANYLDEIYDFGELKDIFAKNMVITNGGMQGFNIICDAINSMNNNEKKFYYNEASFMPIVDVAKMRFGENAPCKILKQKNSTNFFINSNDIDNIYSNNKDNSQNIFYFIPVGNPTGVKIDEEELYNISKKIIEKDENAIIILDSVYMGLLEATASKQYYQKIFNDKKVLNRIIFIESFSKSLGLTGLRIGTLFTYNDNLFIEMQKSASATTAGYSKLPSLYLKGLLQNKTDIINLKEIYNYWSEIRLQTYDYFKENFSHLFDIDNSLVPEEREGLYLFLKLKDGIKEEEVYIETGVIGVGVDLSDGTYIRYSMGLV
ncbi:MAG: pyridoxal phosphate-dependent aminotransferase [Candidatus Gracilibacteria bacterium]|nr:pyridoxal phosphate-dependent aminotransferase [Candidatus Gracilibacteria bacterium]